MRKAALGALMMLSAWPLTAAARTPGSVPVAYFSPQRAFAALPDGKEVEAKLVALQAERGKELDARNQKLKDAQAEFLGVRQQSENAFALKLQPALAAVAKAKGLLFVINEDHGSIVWADPVADITTEVVQRIRAVAAQ